jgi:hypothetical protein
MRRLFGNIVNQLIENSLLVKHMLISKRGSTPRLANSRVGAYATL